jgi:hypothetical protein
MSANAGDIEGIGQDFARQVEHLTRAEAMGVAASMLWAIIEGTPEPLRGHLIVEAFRLLTANALGVRL